jgi:hypothetical protein
VSCFSDELNQASMIEGIRHSRARKLIFAHNDPVDLDRKLAALDPSVPKLVAFESVYSMDGDIAPLDPSHQARWHLTNRNKRGVTLYLKSSAWAAHWLALPGDARKEARLAPRL